jgi:hypothetical protein
MGVLELMKQSRHREGMGLLMLFLSSHCGAGFSDYFKRSLNKQILK